MSSFNELRRLCADPLPHPDSATLRTWSEQALQWLLHHHETLPDQGIGLSPSREQMEALLREPAPETGRDFAEILAEFDAKVAPNCRRINHPLYLAYIPIAPPFASVLGDLLSTGTSFFAGTWVASAGAAQVELLVLDWFKEILGYPAEASGILTAGGSEANLTALVVARERLSFEERGRAVLYLTEQRHWSVDRAAKIIGLRPDQLRPLPADDQFRLRAEDLRRAVAEDRAAGRFPWAVIANAGSTSAGVIDPLAELADVSRDERLWLHVDGAYGWAAALISEGRAALDGIARADSITLDPHKWFAQPYEVGGVLVRDGRRLVETFAVRPDYMQDVGSIGEEVHFADRGIALTRRFRALKIWMSVKVMGLEWFRTLVERSCRLADFAQALLERSPVFEVLSPRQLSVVCFRYRPPQLTLSEKELDRLNLELVEALWATNRAFISSTRLRGRVALRICFVNWRTTAADVEEVVRLLTELGAGLTLSADRNPE